PGVAAQHVRGDLRRTEVALGECELAVHLIEDRRAAWKFEAVFCQRVFAVDASRGQLREGQIDLERELPRTVGLRALRDVFGPFGHGTFSNEAQEVARG